MVIFSIGLFAVPQAFADHDEITIETAAGSSTPGCEPNCFIPSVATLSKADTEVTWPNTDTAAHTITSGGEDPLKALKLRFAKGEITKEEFLEMKSMLE